MSLKRKIEKERNLMKEKCSKIQGKENKVKEWVRKKKRMKKRKWVSVRKMRIKTENE